MNNTLAFQARHLGLHSSVRMCYRVSEISSCAGQISIGRVHTLDDECYHPCCFSGSPFQRSREYTYSCEARGSARFERPRHTSTHSPCSRSIQVFSSFFHSPSGPKSESSFVRASWVLVKSLRTELRVFDRSLNFFRASITSYRHGGESGDSKVISLGILTRCI